MPQPEPRTNGSHNGKGFRELDREIARPKLLAEKEPDNSILKALEGNY